jgi:transcription elongation factor
MPKSTQTHRNIGRSHDNTLGNSIYDLDTIGDCSVNMGVVCNDKNNT